MTNWRNLENILVIIIGPIIFLINIIWIYNAKQVHKIQKIESNRNVQLTSRELSSNLGSLKSNVKPHSPKRKQINFFHAPTFIRYNMLIASLFYTGQSIRFFGYTGTYYFIYILSSSMTNAIFVVVVTFIVIQWIVLQRNVVQMTPFRNQAKRIKIITILLYVFIMTCSLISVILQAIENRRIYDLILYFGGILIELLVLICGIVFYSYIEKMMSKAVDDKVKKRNRLYVNIAFIVIFIVICSQIWMIVTIFHNPNQNFYPDTTKSKGVARNFIFTSIQSVILIIFTIYVRVPRIQKKLLRLIRYSFQSEISKQISSDDIQNRNETSTTTNNQIVSLSSNSSHSVVSKNHNTTNNQIVSLSSNSSHSVVSKNHKKRNSSIKKFVDDKTGLPYYYDEDTGQSAWEKPDDDQIIIEESQH